MLLRHHKLYFLVYIYALCYIIALETEVVRMLILSSLVAPEFVITTNFGTISDDKVCIMEILCFDCVIPSPLETFLCSY